MTDDRPAVPASMPWRGTGQARANSAARDAKPPVEAEADIERLREAKGLPPLPASSP